MYINGTTITTTKSVLRSIIRKIELDMDIHYDDLINITIETDLPEPKIWKPSKTPCNNTVIRRGIIDDSIEVHGE